MECYIGGKKMVPQGNAALKLGPEHELTPEEIVDFTHWPITIMTPPKWKDEYIEYYQEEVKRRGERYALVLDVRDTIKPNPAERKRLTNSLSKSEFNKKYCVCCAMIFSSAITRGILTAVFWLHKPQYPIKVFATPEEGLEWAKTLF